MEVTWVLSGTENPALSLHPSRGGHFPHFTDETTMAQRQPPPKAGAHSQAGHWGSGPALLLSLGPLSPAHMWVVQPAGRRACGPQQAAGGGGRGEGVGLSQHT